MASPKSSGGGIMGTIGRRFFGGGGAGGTDPDSVVDGGCSGRVLKLTEVLKIKTKNPKLNLKNSPPYLQGILIDTQELITHVFQKSAIDELQQLLYLKVTVARIVQHTKSILKLFKDTPSRLMENETSKERAKLTQMTLVYSHILSELKTICKDGVFQRSFKIVKQEPRDFWAKCFGSTVIVPWDQFAEAFNYVCPISGPEERENLKATIDLLVNDHVSWFEFDIFTRLYQPWKQIMNNWRVITIKHPGYCAFITYDQVEGTLQQFKHKPGSYVFRLSCTRLGQWAIGFVTPGNEIVQTIPQSKSLYEALIDGAADGTYKYPAGETENIDMRSMITVAPEEHIKVSKEQYDIYCDIETTFEMCKICDNSVKSIRIDPCGHLLCRDCLKSWMDQNRGNREPAACPFCREGIMSTESIIVEPYKPAGMSGVGSAGGGGGSVEVENSSEGEYNIAGDLLRTTLGVVGAGDDSDDSDDDHQAPPPIPVARSQAAGAVLPPPPPVQPRSAAQGVSVAVNPARIAPGLGRPPRLHAGGRPAAPRLPPRAVGHTESGPPVLTTTSGGRPVDVPHFGAPPVARSAVQTGQGAHLAVQIDTRSLRQMTEMGFPKEQCIDALRKAGGNLQLAIQELLG